MDFNKLLNTKTSSIDKFREVIEKENAKSFSKDEGFWQPTVDKAGNGFAVIRFLPAPPQDGEDGLPWQKLFSHGFQGPTGLWYIENSLTTLNKDDPVSEYNSKLWATGLESNKKIVREQKRKLTYISNIYVIKDPGNPDNEGKVFKFKYGKKIFDKIKEAMDPKSFDEFTDKEAIDPFHFMTGADFKLKIRKVEGYRNYDKSEFDQPTQFLGGDVKALKAVWEQEFSLKELVAADKFKDYATLKQRLDRVLGIDTSGASNESVLPADEVGSQPKAAPKTAKTAESISLGNDDDPELFKDLAEED
jgi:hypothetical protein